MATDYTNLQKIAQQYQPNRPYQPKPQKPGSGAGCIIILIFLAFFIIMGLLIYFWVYPNYFAGYFEKEDITVVDKKTGKEKKVSHKSSLSGILSNAIIAKDEDENNFLWVMTYKYKNSKYILNTYLYNPEENDVIKNIETESSAYPLTKIFFVKNEVWKVNSASSDLEAEVVIYYPVDGTIKSNTRSLMEKYPELQGGISNLYLSENPFYLNFETKDGRKPVLNIETGTMYQNSSEFRNSFKNDKTEINIFSLGIEKSGEEARKKLFLVTGPKATLWDKNIPESYFNNSSTLKFFLKSEAKRLNDKVYLEGILPYQDEECCIIFHQTQSGNEAERILSCIDDKGNTLWSVSTEDELFTKLRATSKDAFSTMFFIKSNIHVYRNGNLVLLTLDRFGFQGFDFKTGRKLFEQELSK